MKFSSSPFLLLFLITINCSTYRESVSTTSEENIYKIDLSEQGLSKSNTPKLSSLAEKIEYIPLETTDKSLVKGNHQVYVSEKFIYTIAFRQILQFDRVSGEFIKEIGRYGSGPDQYLATLPNVPSFNLDQPIVVTAKYVKTIDTETNELSTIAKKNSESRSFAMLDSSTFAGFLPNFACNQKDKIVIYNKNGEEERRFKNHLSCSLKDTNLFSFDLSEGQFYYYNSSVYFKEIYNDTIFRVNKNGLTKHAFFNLGNRGVHYSQKENLDEEERQNRIIINKVLESNNFIFFNYSYQNKVFYGFFDKDQKTLSIPEKKTDRNGISNDIHQFLDFNPLTISSQNELVSYYYPENILEWFKERGDLETILPPLKKLEQVKYDANPIVAIVTLKEN